MAPLHGDTRLAELHSQRSCSHEIPHPGLRVDSPQHQLWGWLGSTELPFVTTGTRAAANPAPSSAALPSMGQALGCPCCPGRKGAEGNTSQDASNASAADPRQVLSLFKTLPAFRINPLNATANQNKRENPSLPPQPDGKPLDAPCPHVLSATGPGHHPDVTREGTAAGGAAGLVVAQGTPMELSQLCTAGTVS